MHAFWSIPELWLAVLKLLELKDLGRMTRVCHMLWLDAARILWKRLPMMWMLTQLVPQEDRATSNLNPVGSIPCPNALLPLTSFLLSQQMRLTRLRIYAAFVEDLRPFLWDADIRFLYRIRSQDASADPLPNVHSLRLALHRGITADTANILPSILPSTLRYIEVLFSDASFIWSEACLPNHTVWLASSNRDLPQIKSTGRGEA